MSISNNATRSENREPAASEPDHQKLFETLSKNGIPIPKAPEELRKKLRDAPKQKTVVTYSLDMDRKYYFDYLVSRNLYEKEWEAFEEIGKKLENGGEMTRTEISRIFNDHVKSPYPKNMSIRLSRILRDLVDAHVLNKHKRIIEKTESATPALQDCNTP